MSPKHLSVVGGNGGEASPPLPPESIWKDQILAVAKEAIDEGAVTCLFLFELPNGEMAVRAMPDSTNVEYGYAKRYADYVWPEENEFSFEVD